MAKGKEGEEEVKVESEGERETKDREEAIALHATNLGSISGIPKPTPEHLFNCVSHRDLI